MMLTLLINSTEELPFAAGKIIEAFGDERVFAFYGKMGAGKTTLIKTLCRVMGSNDNITSPTFALINEYTATGGEKIYHFDFYRIRNIEEALDIGFEEYLSSGHFCFLEWPENIEPLLPRQFVEVHIVERYGATRQITATRKE